MIKYVRFTIITVTCALVLLFASETVMRVFFKHSLEQSLYSPFWEPHWGDKYVSLNDDGFRDRRHDLKKKDGVYRIAIIGDSYTFGWLIKDPKDRYSGVLEHLLNAGARQTGSGSIREYEVMNFSIPGIGNLREMEIYEKYVKKYNPDLVILGVLPNDILSTKAKGVELDPSITKKLLKHSYLFRYLVIKKLLHDFKSYKWLDIYLKRIQTAFQSPEEKKFFSTNVGEFKKKCNDNNSDFLVILFPLFLNFNEYPLDKERLEMVEMLAEKDIDIIDIFPYFKGRDARKLIVNDFDPHPDEKAHSIIANAVYGELTRRNLLNNRHAAPPEKASVR